MKENNSLLPRLLTLRQASQVLNRSEKQVRRHIELGQLKAHRAMRHIRISVDEIERFISGGKP